MWGLQWLGPLELLMLRVVYTVPPAIHQFQLRFSFPGAGSHQSCSSSKVWFSVFVSWYLQFRKQGFDLWPHFSFGSKKNCWFFSLFSILLVVRMEKQLPSFLSALPESRSLLRFYHWALKRLGNSLWIVARSLSSSSSHLFPGFTLLFLWGSQELYVNGLPILLREGSLARTIYKCQGWSVLPF